MIKSLKKIRNAAQVVVGVASSSVAAVMVSAFFLAHYIEYLLRKE
jgi:hypothetical protein